MLDNGKEFAGHEKIATALDVGVCFAHPYHSWERGLNENSNGLLRHNQRLAGVVYRLVVLPVLPQGDGVDPCDRGRSATRSG